MPTRRVDSCDFADGPGHPRAFSALSRTSVRHTSRLAAAWAALFFVSAAALPSPADALERADICMAIGLDVSGSMEPEEMRLQFDGLARALNHPRLLRAVQSGLHGITAVSVFTWSANREADVVVPWTGISSSKDTEGIAARLFGLPARNGHGNTSLTLAIQTGVALLETCPWYAERQLLNIAGDGVTNNYPGPMAARDAANDRGIVINGLVIASEEFAALNHYRTEVVGPRGVGFVVLIDDFRGFSDGMLRKLLLEIAMVSE